MVKVEWNNTFQIVYVSYDYLINGRLCKNLISSFLQYYRFCVSSSLSPLDILPDLRKYILFFLNSGMGQDTRSLEIDQLIHTTIPPPSFPLSPPLPSSNQFFPPPLPLPSQSQYGTRKTYHSYLSRTFHNLYKSLSIFIKICKGKEVQAKSEHRLKDCCM